MSEDRRARTIDRLSEPTWYVLDRTKLYSYADYAATADRMDAIAVLFPVFFFAVAALVCLTTMTRMVDEQRTAIGAYKALGYGEPAITFKYAAYAALDSLIGGVVGVVVGINTFPRVIFDSWAMMYELPPMEQVPQYALLVGTVAVSVLLTTATAYLAVRNELTSVPAALMRPKAPKAGKIILLERVPALWSRLSFSQKVTMRNIFRYKKRFFMTVIGVAGCAALLVAGFGLSDSIGSIVPRQYGQILKPDLDVRFAPAATEADRAPVVSALAADAGVAGFLQVAELNATVKGPKDELAATLVVPLDLDRFPDFVSLRTRDGQVPLPLQQTGAVITEAGGVLGVRIGDMIPIDRGTGVFKQVVVTGIAENYVFHYVYLSPDAFREVFGADAEPSAVFVKTAALDKDAETALGTRLMDLGHVASVTYYSDAVTKFAETIKSLDTIVWAMIISAALLAFVVLYNLTIINLSERVREIATIKVLEPSIARWPLTSTARTSCSRSSVPLPGSSSGWVCTGDHDVDRAGQRDVRQLHLRLELCDRLRAHCLLRRGRERLHLPEVDRRGDGRIAEVHRVRSRPWRSAPTTTSPRPRSFRS